jgi:hypothetical protein
MTTVSIAPVTSLFLASPIAPVPSLFSTSPIAPVTSLTSTFSTSPIVHHFSSSFESRERIEVF